MPTTMPILESLSTKFMTNYNEQTAKTLNTIFETFYAAINLELPEYFYNQDNINTWMVVLKTILVSPMDSKLTNIPQNDVEKEKLEQNIFWKNKIIVLRILYNWIQRNGSVKFADT